MAKRYVLFFSDADLVDRDAKDLATILHGRIGAVKVVLLKDNPRAVVVKTDNWGAPELRTEKGIFVEGKRLTPVLTSGAIGKLKKRAMGGAVTRHGQVHE